MSSTTDYIYDCGCPIRADMTKDELLNEVYRHKNMCTDKWICSNADREWRRACKDADSKRWRIKKMKQMGATEEEIKLLSSKKRAPKKVKAIDLDLDAI